MEENPSINILLNLLNEIRFESEEEVFSKEMFEQLSKIKQAVEKEESSEVGQPENQDRTKEERIYTEAQKERYEEAKGIILKCIELIHANFKRQQEEKKKEVEEKIKSGEIQVSKDNILDQKEYTKRTLFEVNYAKAIPFVLKCMEKLSKLYGTPVYLDKTLWKKTGHKGRKRMIPRSVYFNLYTGQYEDLELMEFHSIRTEGERRIKDLKGHNCPIIQGPAFKEEELKQTTVKESLQGVGASVKLVNQLNKDLKYTDDNYVKEKLKDLFFKENVNKTNELDIKDQEVYLDMDVNELINMLHMLQELQLCATQVQRHRLFAEWNQNIESEKKTNDVTTLDRLQKYFEKRRVDENFQEIFEKRIKLELYKGNLPTCCLSKEMHGTGFKMHVCVDKKAREDDVTRIHYKLEDPKGNMSDVYVIKKSDIDKKMKDICALLSMSPFYPKASFQWWLLTNYVMKPTDEKETLLGLDHFISNPDSLLVGVRKLRQQLENGKYNVHRNTNDVAHFVLQMLRDCGKTRNFNHSATIFQPRKRSGNEATLLSMMTEYWKDRELAADQGSIDKLLEKILNKSIFTEKDNLNGIISALTQMKEITGKSLMATKSSNGTECDKIETLEDGTCLIEGKYHSRLTAQTVAQYCGVEVTHLTLQSVLSKLTDKCLVRIFIKEMMGGMRDIAILPAQWKVACALTEELCKRISLGLDNDLIQKESSKASIITQKLKNLEKEYSRIYKKKGRLLVIEIDFTKWNAHQDTEILMKVAGTIIDSLLGWKSSASVYMETVGKMYKEKMMQVECSRLESTILSHIALDEQNQGRFVLTRADLDKIHKLRNSPESMFNTSICDLSMEVYEKLLLSKEDKIDWRKKIVALPVRHGMGQGIMSTGSSIFGCMVYRMVLPELKRYFSINGVSDYVLTSDDGNIYLMLDPKDKMFQLKYQEEFAKKFNECVKLFGLKINEAKVKFDSDGFFTFNSSDHNYERIFSQDQMTKYECLNRYYKGFGSHQFSSPFEQFLRYETWLIFLSNILQLSPTEVDKYVKHYGAIMDRMNFNFVQLDGFSMEESQMIYSTVSKIKLNGHYYLTNRAEVHCLMSNNPSVETDYRLDLTKVDRLCRESTSALGFTFRNPKFRSGKVLNHSDYMKYTKTGNVSTQMEMLKHVAKETSSADKFSSYFRTVYSGWIKFADLASQPIKSINTVEMSQLSRELMSDDLTAYPHLYSFTCEDNTDVFERPLVLTQEIFVEILETGVLSPKHSEVLLMLLTNLEGVLSDNDVKRLSTFIHPGREGVYLGSVAEPKEQQTLYDYLKQDACADPWVVPQVKVGSSWLHHGIIKFYDEGEWINYMLLDNNLVGCFKFNEEGKIVKVEREKPAFLVNFKETEFKESVILDFLSSTMFLNGKWMIWRTASNLSDKESRAMRRSRLLLNGKLNQIQVNQIMADQAERLVNIKRKQEADEPF